MDISFLPALTACLVRPLATAEQRRNCSRLQTSPARFQRPQASTRSLRAQWDGACGDDARDLGHTGRPLVAPRGVPLAYAMVHLGAVARVGVSLLPNMPALIAASVLWAGAFGLFVALYAPIRIGRRVDARKTSREVPA
jgi:uncharacterized protein involved in response to NO